MPEVDCPLAVAAAGPGNAVAFMGPEGVLTYCEYDRRASAAALRLRASGLWPGDRLAVLASTSVDLCILLMGCIRAGVVACPLSTRLPSEAAEEAVEFLGCRALAADRSMPGRNTLAVDEIAADEDAPGWRGGVPLDQPAVVVFTSGSSGRPKAALLSYGNLYANARASNDHIPLEQGHRWILSLPMYHVSGLGVVFRCLVSGAAVVVPGDDADLAESMAQGGVTHASLVTTQLQRLLSRPEGVRALGGLEAILLGGNAMPPRLVGEALDRGLPIRASYGLTEMASQVATTTAADRTPDGLRRATPLIPGSVRISPDGEIEVNGPTRFQGYVEGENLEEPFREGGWFPTGDLGALDADGRLTVFGRRDNLFISGGENIQPEEIERELCALEGVAQAVVAPVDDEEYGQRPVAFVRTESGAAVDAERLRNALQRRLPQFKIPELFLPWPEELDATGGKVQRPAFAELARAAKEK